MIRRVSFTTNFDVDPATAGLQAGVFVIELYPDKAPLTVQNFLNYVTSTRYIANYDDMFFHRAVTGVLVQTGGYKIINGKVNSILTDPPVPTEFDSSGLHNTAGSIGMAHVGSDLNSGTDQFFINLRNNSTDFDPGKYTVFGQVIEGFDVLQTIGALPKVNLGSTGPFNTMPVQNYTPPAPVELSNLVSITDLTVLPAIKSDFNGDGRSDVLFDIPGVTFNSDYMWQMNDRSIAAQGAIDLYDKAFNVQVTGDFDGDGKSDVVFQNPTTGGAWMWLLDGTTIKSQGAVDVGDPSFDLLGSADFNGDAKDDLLFRNDDGFVFMWQMDGRANTPRAVGPLDPSWHVAGAGDFDGDGKADILLHNVSATPDNGAYFLWKMDGSAIIGQGGIERPDASWHTLAVGDFDGDGKSDFAIRNESGTTDEGAVWVYLMDGTTIKAQGAAGIVKASEFHTVGVGDYNGDGKDDILFRNDAGYFYSWDMDGKVIQSEGAFGTEAGNFADPAASVVTQHWDLL